MLQYYEFIDSTIATIEKRFDQPGYVMYCNVEGLLIKSAKQQDFSEEFKVVSDFYRDDLKPIRKWYVSNALKIEVSMSLRDSTTSLSVLRDLWPTMPVLLTTCLPFSKPIRHHNHPLQGIHAS